MIPEIKNRVSVMDCLSHFGVSVPPRGHNVVMAHCPYHEDKTPSFAVYRHDNRAWCHACQKGGDVIDLTALFLDSGISEAVAYWRDRLGLSASSPSPADRLQLSEAQKLRKLRDHVRRRSLELERFDFPKIPAMESHLVYVFGEKEDLDQRFKGADSKVDMLIYLTELVRWHSWAEATLNGAWMDCQKRAFRTLARNLKEDRVNVRDMLDGSTKPQRNIANFGTHRLLKAEVKETTHV